MRAVQILYATCADFVALAATRGNATFSQLLTAGKRFAATVATATPTQHAFVRTVRPPTNHGKLANFTASEINELHTQHYSQLSNINQENWCLL